MRSSLTTYEHRLREWLLNLLYAQWRSLGIPFSASPPSRPREPIDPEALLWCSLEFFPTQPRLCEQVLAWLASNDQSLLRPRIRKFARGQDEPRAFLWQQLDPQWRVAPPPPSRPCYGQRTASDLVDFGGGLGRLARQAKLPRQQPGRPEATPATAILRARDAVGADAKHFILVYLLATGGGARLKSVAEWSGQTYRNIAKAAQRWEAAEILTLEHGYARLRNPGVWSTVLHVDPRGIVLLNWLRLYEACLKLLASLVKAEAKSLPPDGPVVTALFREAQDAVAASVEGQPFTPSETVRDFAQLISSFS